MCEARLTQKPAARPKLLFTQIKGATEVFQKNQMSPDSTNTGIVSWIVCDHCLFCAQTHSGLRRWLEALRGRKHGATTNTTTVNCSQRKQPSLREKAPGDRFIATLQMEHVHKQRVLSLFKQTPPHLAL